MELDRMNGIKRTDYCGTLNRKNEGQKSLGKARGYAGLPPGPARSWLTDADGTVIAPLTAAQRSHLQEVRSVLGSYDGQTQARALLRAAGLLEQERDALAQTSPAALRSKQALVLSGAAVLTILLL